MHITCGARDDGRGCLQWAAQSTATSSRGRCKLPALRVDGVAGSATGRRRRSGATHEAVVLVLQAAHHRGQLALLVHVGL